MTGILLVDKPAGMTSHDVVDRIRKVANLRRVGHTGTLDPNATGLLILCLGKATRLSEHLTGLDKTYEGTMRLGVTTDSFDSDGEVVEEREVPELSVEAIQNVCDEFLGDIEQLPPMVSAVKVGGQPLYKRARKGETVERQPRPVTIHEFVVIGYDAPDATVRVKCSRGTYVRALCNDVGEELGCGGMLAALRRTEVGKHSVANAVKLDDLHEREDVFQHLIPMGEALDYPAVTVRGESRSVVASGGTLAPRDLIKPCLNTEGWVQVMADNGHLLALGLIETSAAGAMIHPKRVFD